MILGTHKKENSIRPKFMTKCLSISEILKCMKIMQLRIDKMQVTRIIRKKYKRTKILMEHYQKQIYVILIWWIEILQNIFRKIGQIAEEITQKVIMLFREIGGRRKLLESPDLVTNILSTFCLFWWYAYIILINIKII